MCGRRSHRNENGLLTNVDVPPAREAQHTPNGSHACAKGVTDPSGSVLRGHYSTTRKARVKQVKQRPPSMVLAPSLYKIGCGLAAADEQLRFSLGAFHQPHCYCPPTRDKELRLSSRWAHKTAGDDDEMLTLFA